jgi:hypothetical protein
MKVSLNPRIMEHIGRGVKVEHPVGSVTFASFDRIVRGMKAGDEMPEHWHVTGVVIEKDGIAFVFGTKEQA